ncbi:MAG: aminotransferase class III-fold pyridoxal phosphate-dependent enzyme [Oscillospiraceae bacterium]|nr:aminotransferase class III-fold pyridoxal phosphate-dependent enzyme [Oscillospiraceae bacterium]
MSISQDYYKKAKRLIPGGVQLLSKRPEQFAPGQWPGYAVRAQGCRVLDLDGNWYYDMTTNGIGACLLGYADPDVSRAVVRRVEDGAMSTLNCPEEVALAERLIQLHPWAENVRFARTGGEICAVAVRIARATTGRDVVAICGYHGWSDWYLSANLGDGQALDGQLLPGLSPAGVPRGLKDSAVTFQYDDFEGFDRVIRGYGDRLACVIMEPARHHLPKPGFLEHVRDAVHKAGGLLIFDEITIGWRLTYGGSHRLLGVTPDLATFAKALGNGHPIAAVIGTRAAMEGAHTSFISSTYWTEGVGCAAALAALEKMERTRVWEHVKAVGEQVLADWTAAAARHGVDIVPGTGFACLAEFRFAHCPQALKTLYTVLMLREGFLGNTAIYPTLAHTEEVLDLHRAALDRVFARIAGIWRAGGEEAVLAAIGGPVCQSGFKRLID